MNRRARFILPFLFSSFVPVLALAQANIAAGTGNFNANTSGVSYQLNAGDTRSVTTGTTETISIGAASGTYTLIVNGTVSQTGTGRGIRTSSNNVTFNVTIGATGLVKAVGDDAFQARNGTVNLTNLGTLYSGADLSATSSAPAISGRGINVRDAAGGVIVNGAIDNTTALIRSDGNDAVRVGSNFSFTNYGVILADGVVNDSAANNSLNPAGGSLSRDTAKTYTAGGGFSFEDASDTAGATNSSLTNYGTISGARHGVQAGELGSGLTVTNMAGGLIIGRNGSGVGFDTTTTDPSKIVVNNSGLIRGDYAGGGHVIDQTGALSPTQDGDGDGVDIDGAATIRNYATGQIISTGAGGFDTSGRTNNSEAISIGGGVIVNDGVIRGADRGIVVNNDSVASRSGVAATTITNNAGATIEGQNGFAIRLENKLGTAADNDTITNAGTIIGRGTIPSASATITIQRGATDANSTGTLDGVTYAGTGSSRFISGDGSAIQMGEGADVLNNTGTIIGMNGLAINMEGGDDIVNFDAGTITGTIDGGAGNDTLNLGAGISTTSDVARFEQVNVASGTATLAGVVSGTTLTKGGAGTLVLLSANTTTGLTTVAAGILCVNNFTGSATGSGNVIVNSGATLAGTGIVGGNVTFNGLLSPGDAAALGTLTVNSNVTWNGGVWPANAWQFDLGEAGASDRLLVGGDFLKGTAGDFVFDFQSGATTGTFILVDWTGATTFTAGDFSYINLADGLTGTFAFNGSQLEFTTTGSAIPEPSTYAALFGAAVLGLAFWRRGKAHRLKPFSLPNSKQTMNTHIIKNIFAGLVLAAAGTLGASADPQTLFITEVYPSGSGASYGADWFELTNYGSTAIDITGWKVDDSSASFSAALALRGVTSIAAGQSVVFAEANSGATNDATIIANFKTAWFGSSVPSDFLMGTYGGSGIGLSTDGDGVNIYDASGNLIANISFGTTTAGATLDNAAKVNNAPVSTISVAGANGAFTSFDSTAVGSPGSVSAVPEPATCAAIFGAAVLGLAFWHRRLTRN